MHECGIYIITNQVNGKQYIGQSNDIHRRWWEHKARAFDPNNNCYHKPLYCAFRKYGLHNFSFSIVETCHIAELNAAEKRWILQLNTIAPNGYNVLEESLRDRSAEEIQAYNEGLTLRQLKNGCCSDCGKPLAWKTAHGLCSKCYPLHTRKVNRPSAEQLYQLLLTHSFVAVGQMYGVSDNAVRKWCQQYDIPSHTRDYIAIKAAGIV